MINPNLRNLTNHFQDVRLVSLNSWRQANEIVPRDRGGPYIVLQEGYDPGDLRMIGREFILGRSGQWLALEHFYHLPIADRRAEFVFGQAAEVIQMMNELPTKVAMMNRPEPKEGAAPESDELAAAIKAGKEQKGSAGST
jgi:hypothetical protein